MGCIWTAPDECYQMIVGHTGDLAKTAELTEMLFGRQTHVVPKDHDKSGR